MKQDWEMNKMICEDITRIIKEELGIADEVKNMVDTIYNKIMEIAKNTESDIIEDGTSLKFNNFTMKDVYSTNEYDNNIANALYMTFQSEIEGYANGLYAFTINLKNNYYNNGSLNTVYRQSEAFKQLQKVYKCREFILEHRDDEEFNKAIMKYNKFGVYKDNIIKKIDMAIKEMNTRFGKALMKAKKDWIEMGGFNDRIETFEFKHYD